MSNNPIPLKKANTKGVTSHVSGTPTIEELRMRVSARKQKGKKCKPAKKTSQ